MCLLLISDAPTTHQDQDMATNALNHWLRADHATKTAAQPSAAAFSPTDMPYHTHSTPQSTKQNVKHGKELHLHSKLYKILHSHIF